jgi:hypothetical protein
MATASGGWLPAVATWPGRPKSEHGASECQTFRHPAPGETVAQTDASPARHGFEAAATV